MIGREMPKYQSHKQVWALKIKSIVKDGEGENRETDGSAVITPEEEGYAPFKVDWEYMSKHKPQVGGYYVAYKDGYKSFCPAKEFEEGNTLIVVSDFKARLQTERNELEEKLTKLNDFNASEKANEIEPIQKSLLIVQAGAMHTYLECLKERLVRL